MTDQAKKVIKKIYLQKDGAPTKVQTGLRDWPSVDIYLKTAIIDQLFHVIVK